MAETLWVRSGLVDKVAERVALFELDDRHPGGSAFVAGSDSPPVEVGRTSVVVKHLHDGRLKEAKESDLIQWRERKEIARQQALVMDAAMFPGAQRGADSNRIAALEAQVAALQTAVAPRPAAKG